MQDITNDKPGVIAPPPLIFATGLVGGLLLHVAFPVSVLPRVAGFGLGGILIVLAGIFAVGASWAFRRAGTNINPTKPAIALVTEGPFRVSRNPFYLSLTLLYVGIALCTNALWPLLFLLPLLIVIQRGVIEREEQYLELKFGEDYRRYKARVRRWI